MEYHTKIMHVFRLRSKPVWVILPIVMLLCLYTVFQKGMRPVSLMDSALPEETGVSLAKREVQKHFEIQNQRKKTIIEECQKSEYFHRNASKNYGDIQVVRKHSLLYCAIAKVGCTFFTRLMLALTAGRGEYSSVFDISPGDTHSRYIERLPKVPEPLRTFMKKNFTKIMFVRDPYARLFSGYVDKFFTPQTAFHKNYGRYIINRFRKDASSKSLKCGHDVSFSEFVKYVMASIKGRAKPNPHFMPMYLQCDPCTQSYDLIGRLETLRDDLSLVLTPEEKKYYLPENIKELSQLDEMRDAVSIAFSNRQAQKGCLTFHQILQRIWRRLQIRGLLSRHIDYPLMESRSESVSRETFQQILNIALVKSWRDQSTRRNRREAMTEAFNTLPRQDLQELSSLLKIDCKLFGYDTQPDFIFKPNVTGCPDFKFF